MLNIRCRCVKLHATKLVLGGIILAVNSTINSSSNTHICTYFHGPQGMKLERILVRGCFPHRLGSRKNPLPGSHSVSLMVTWSVYHPVWDEGEGRERGREGGREGREGGRKGEKREGGREERGREEGREGGREGGRKKGREVKREVKREEEREGREGRNIIKCAGVQWKDVVEDTETKINSSNEN